MQQQQTTNDNLQETRTDRLLDQSSYNPTSHNATTTLTRRAQLDCDSPDSLQDKTNYLNNIFSKNDYNTDFVRRNTHSNTDTNTQTNVNSGSVYDSNYTVQRTKAPLKLLHVYYNPSIQVLHTSRYPLYEDFLLMSRTKTNWRTDREQYIQDQMLQLPSFLHW